METLIALCGVGVLIGAAYLMSENRKAINWRLVGAGIGLQVILALLILKVPGSKEAFSALGHGIEKLLDCAVDGAAFVFGDELARGKYIFLVRIGSSIIFVASLASLAYYLGIMQRIVRGLARVLVKTMGISGPEALSAASAVFVGQVECQVLIKPYMASLTRSELFCSMAAAMATISGSALIAYTGLGMNATYLIAASIMSAPAGIVMAKIMIPESNVKALSTSMDLATPPSGANAFDAMVHGAMDGAKIAGSVMIMVLVAIATVSLINGSLAWGFSFFGTSLQIQDIFAVPMMPVAFLMGVPYHECFYVARLMATEILVNEFVSYGELAKVMQGTAPYSLSLKTQMIATFALCGFANLGSIAINIGGLGAMVPERRSEIAKLALRALIAANMGTWITAAIAGILFSV